jgi:hypothetical protein
MDPSEAVDLGHGMRLVPLPGDDLQLRSRDLELPWTVRSGKTPGSAVLWRGTPFEVVAMSRVRSTAVWTLRPWPDQEAMRGVITLDDGWLEMLARRQAERQTEARRRWLLLPLTPVLGLAPARLQRRWRSEWGFAASAGTGLSALAEIAAGTLGVVQSLAAGLGGEWFLPWYLRWLVVAGPVLFVVGLVRLHSIVGHGEPLGSPLGLPFALLGRADRDARGDAERRRPREERRRESPSPIRSAWITALACLAPRDLQEEWAPRMGLRPVWLTVIGAGAEGLGGIVNLQAGSGGEPGPWFLVNVFFLLEGLARLALLIATGGPVGSLLGLPLRSWLQRMMDEKPGSRIQDPGSRV